MIKILYQDSTLGSLSLSQETISIQELHSQLPEQSQHATLGFIFEDNTTQVSTKNIRFIIVFNKNTQYPDTSQITVSERRDTTVYPIIVTPNSQTPAIWETSSTDLRKEVTLICNKSGEKKRAIFIRTNQHEFTGDNALVPIDVDDYLIHTTLKKYLYTTIIYKICSWNKTEYTARILLVETLSDDPQISLVSYERFYQTYPYLKSPIRSSKRKVKKGKTWDIHFADYKHLLST